MKTLFAVWVAAIVVIAGCGTTDAGGPAGKGHGGAAGNGPSTSTTTGTSTSTSTDTSTGTSVSAGMGGAAGSSGAGAGGEGGGGGGVIDSGVPRDANGGSDAPLEDAGAVMNWPQAAGPNGTWRLAVNDAPVRWSVAANSGITWRGALPNEGQGGIAVWGDRLFLETFPAGATGMSVSVQGHAVDRATGKILWSVNLQGDAVNSSPVAYSYSDATSWSPVTDGTYVWFFDSAGEMGCWDFSGKEIWRRKFAGQPAEFPFNRQHEPILLGDTIITLELLAPSDPGYRADRANWHYLRGLEKTTGKTKWIAEDASTFYNTAVVGRFSDGSPAILHGRGGPHAVPETPIGISMTSLAPGSEGKSLWRWSPAAVAGGPVDGDTFMALYTMTWDEKYAYWFRNSPEESHLVFDAKTGALVKTQSLIANADVRQWDLNQSKYVLHANVNIRMLADSPAYPLASGEVLHVLPNWHSNIVDRGYHYFFTSTNNHRSGHAPPGHSGPAHCIGRVNVETGKVEYLEVPVGVDRAVGRAERLIYGRSLTTVTNNAQGQDIAGDPRSHTDGWEIPAFFPSPISLGGHVYLQTQLGVTYVVDAGAAVLDDKALLGIGDLGALGQAWSLSGPSYAGGTLYHRSLKEVVAIRATP